MGCEVRCEEIHVTDEAGRAAVAATVGDDRVRERLDDRGQRRVLVAPTRVLCHVRRRAPATVPGLRRRRPIVATEEDPDEVEVERRDDEADAVVAALPEERGGVLSWAAPTTLRMMRPRRSASSLHPEERA